MLVRALVPAYFDPIGTGLNQWEQLIQATQQIAVIAIANPNSGPGEAGDETYRIVISRGSEAGMKVVGYVATNYGQRSVDEIHADVDRWINFYPQIAGIFFDEQTSGDEGIAFYTELFAYARSQIVNALIIGNPGVVPSERYTSDAGADLECLFESNHGFDIFSPPDWTANYPNRFCVLPLGVSTADVMETYVRKSIRQRIGTIYVTDDDLPNPWDRLTGYWNEEVEIIRQLTTSEDSLLRQ